MREHTAPLIPRSVPRSVLPFAPGFALWTGVSLGAADGFVQQIDAIGVLPVKGTELDPLNVPSVGFVTGEDILPERQIGRAVDGDLVVVPEHHQLSETEGAGE